MHPTSGARVVLELASVGAGEVTYDAAVFTPNALHRGRAHVALADGTVTFQAWEPVAPAVWIVELAHAFLRSEWRARRGPDPEAWPARISRWREEKAG